MSVTRRGAMRRIGRVVLGGESRIPARPGRHACWAARAGAPGAWAHARCAGVPKAQVGPRGPRRVHGRGNDIEEGRTRAGAGDASIRLLVLDDSELKRLGIVT